MPTLFLFLSSLLWAGEKEIPQLTKDAPINLLQEKGEIIFEIDLSSPEKGKGKICGLEFRSAVSWGTHLDSLFWNNFKKEVEVIPFKEESDKELVLNLNYAANIIYFDQFPEKKLGFSLKLKNEEKQNFIHLLKEDIFIFVKKELTTLEIHPLLCLHHKSPL